MAAKNMFAGAKTVENPEVSKKGKKEAVRVPIKDLDTLAAINTLVTTLNAVKTSIFEPSVKSDMRQYFIEETVSGDKRPENFRGVGKLSEASCEMRKRSSSSPLNETEEAILTKYGVSFEEVVISPAVEERFFFNPDILKSAKLMKLISGKLSEIPELANMDVIMRQPAKEAETAKVVTDKSFEDAANLTDSDSVSQVLDIIGVLAVKAKMETNDMNEVLKLIQTAGIKLVVDEPKKSKK